jgi:DNA polymerase III epsilon subunit-like protein
MIPKRHRIMFYDVETNGLLPSRSDPFLPEPSKIHTYPHILQLSFVVFNLMTKTIEHQANHYILPPDDVVISPFVTELTGIDMSLCKEKGISIGHAMENFLNAYLKCDTIVSHNAVFDSGMMRVEQLRNNHYFMSYCPQVLHMFNPVYDDFYRIEHFCTMKASIDLCNITVQRKDGTGTYKKWPTLSELHNHLFGYCPLNLHNSMVDSLVGLRCYLKMYHDVEFSNDDYDKLYSIE